MSGTSHDQWSLASFPDHDSLVRALLGWARSAHRDLPWRHRRDPYSVWISEVMLQQTHAQTVIPYYERWMARFPDVSALAVATLDDVLKVWEGLGYYARVRNLHRAAQFLMQVHGGQLPANRQALMQLPGIGPYTAGAILSLAFGQPEPILDSNVRRVLCRVYDVVQDAWQHSTEQRLWQMAADLVMAAPVGQAGNLNEALMELGALVCTPRTPRCEACPLEPHVGNPGLCLARARGVEAQRPVKPPHREVPHHQATAAVIQDDEGCYLLVRRPEDSLLGGLYGFPGGHTAPGEDLKAVLARAVYRETGAQITVGAHVARFDHAYTHFRITLHVFRGYLSPGKPLHRPGAEICWASAAELAAYAMAAIDRKILAALDIPDPEEQERGHTAIRPEMTVRVSTRQG